MRLREIYISSSVPYERGIQHGSQVKEEIERVIVGYKGAFQKKGYTWEEAQENAMRFAPLLEKETPDLMEELHGVADGAKIPFSTALLLNTRYELLKFEKSVTSFSVPEEKDGECTLYAVTPEATLYKETIVGQNWDNSPFIGENLYVMHIDEGNGTKILALTEPAQLTRSGMNNHGIGLSCATLLSLYDTNEPCIPTNFLRRKILQCKSLEEADQCLKSFAPKVSLNYMVGDAKAQKAHVTETNPFENYVLETTNGTVAHGNDFVVNPHIDRFIPADAFSPRHFRGQRLWYLLKQNAGNITPEVLMSCLSDHYGKPASVCNHNAEGGLKTIASTIYCVNRGYGYIAWGNPCETEYEQYNL